MANLTSDFTQPNVTTNYKSSCNYQSYMAINWPQFIEHQFVFVSFQIKCQLVIIFRSFLNEFLILRKMEFFEQNLPFVE